MDAPAWMLNVLFNPERDQSTPPSLPSVTGVIDERNENQWSPLREALIRIFSLLPFGILTALLINERGILLRQKYFKYGLIAIMLARFIFDLFPLLTSSILTFVSGDGNGWCTAITIIMGYHRDGYEATLTSVTFSRLVVAYNRFPASIWWKILIVLLILLVLPIPLSLMDTTYVDSPYCMGAHIGTIGIKTRLYLILGLYAANVIMGISTIRKLVQLRRKALLSEQFHLTIIIWLMSVIPFASCLLTITIGLQEERARPYLQWWMDVLRETGLGVYSVIIIVFVPRIRKTFCTVIRYYHGYCCSRPEQEKVIELESRPFKKTMARNITVAQKERMVVYRSPSTSI